MNITRNDIDNLNSVITIDVQQQDIQEPVDKTLKEYRKKANIPGFRKGQVPMSYIKKQYEEAVKFEEINKILQNSLQDYLKEEDLVLLGQPLPEPKEELDLNADSISFNFEIGLSPEFEVDLSKIKSPIYDIKVSKEDIDKSLANLQKQFGTKEEKDTIGEASFFKSDIKSEDLLKEATLWVDQLKDAKKFVGKKVGDKVKVKAQDLFKDPHNLEYVLGLTHEESHTFNEELTITVKEISGVKPAELNEEFFAKAFPGQDIKTEKEAREYLEKETEKYYEVESNNQLLNDVTEQLLDTIKFDLPEDFLKKFIQSNREEPFTDEELEAEYEKSETPLRYQLIEGKILSNNKINVTPEMLMDKAKEDITARMKQYGYADISDEELQQYAMQMLQNQQQIQQISDQIMKEELVKIYKDQAKLQPKEVTLDEFIEIVKSQGDEKKKAKKG